MRLADVCRLLGHGGELPVVRMQDVQLLVAQPLDVDQAIARSRQGGDELVQLQLDGQAVLVLALLDQEDHQEGDDGGAGVDDELPGVREAEDGARQGPGDDHRDGHGKGARAAGGARDGGRPTLEEGRRRPGPGLLHGASSRPAYAGFAPAPDGTRIAVPPLVSKGDHNLEGLHVLVVEDDEDTREVLTLGLTLYGAEVVAVASASEAVAEL